MIAPPERRASAVVEASAAFVASHRPAAEALGRRLADLLADPESFAAALGEGFAGLVDPAYLDEQERVAPGIGRRLGVRWPLITAVQRTFDRSSRRQSAAHFLWAADRLLRDDILEVRLFALHLLVRLLPNDPERAWQLVRRAAREASNWIIVDSLAHTFGTGILLEPYRWAELEQLVYSPSRWARRLVGSTIATLPFVDRRRGREPQIAEHGLPLITSLIGDGEPDVQKALSWALRSLAVVDPGAVLDFCERETARAARTDDGHRAWVIRDALSKLDAVDPARTADIRRRLEGVRRRSGAASTSQASAIAASFTGLPSAADLPEPPLA